LHEVLGRCRRQSFVRARHEVYYALRNHSELFWSYPDIAALFEVDHTTIMYGVEAHAERLANPDRRVA
jgi:chromosomal replication initiation ATPase DnaA